MVPVHFVFAQEVSSAKAEIGDKVPLTLADDLVFNGTVLARKGASAFVNIIQNAYDAMISDRPYRKGMTQNEGRDAVVKEAGKTFDPDVVKAFESAFRKQRLEIPEVMV